PPSPRLSLRVAIRPPATGATPLRAQRRALLRYRIAVTNAGSRPYHFGPVCPLYIEQLGGVPARAYILNCHAAGDIAKRHSLLFAIALPVPAVVHLGSNELTFELAPRTINAPVAQAPVWVVGR